MMKGIVARVSIVCLIQS